MSDTIIEEPDDAKEIWENHLKDGYRNLPSRNTYNKVVQNSVVETKVNNKRESITVLHHTFDEYTKTHPLSVDISEKYMEEPDDLSQIDPFETEHLLRSQDVVTCETCEGSGIYCNNCYDRGTRPCPEDNCSGGMIEIDCGCNYGRVTSTCSACGGSGYSIKEQCRQCNGTGTYFEGGSEQKCRKCDSNGIFKEICYECDNGEVTEECPDCNGDGTLTKGQCKTCGQYAETDGGRIPCPECENQSKELECENCEGNGEVVEVELLDVINKSISSANEEKNFKDKHLAKLDDLEYKVRDEQQFDTMEELRLCRSEEISTELPDDLKEEAEDIENIDRIEYKYETTQSIKRYAYHHTDKIYTLKSSVHYKFKDRDTYYFKKIEGIPRVATIEVSQDGKVVDKMPTGYFIYGSWFKAAVVNLSSNYTTPTLSLSQKLIGFIPGVLAAVYKNGILSSAMLYWFCTILAAIPATITVFGLIILFDIEGLFGLTGEAYLYSVDGVYALILYIILYVFGEEDPTPKIDDSLLRD